MYIDWSREVVVDFFFTYFFIELNSWNEPTCTRVRALVFISSKIQNKLIPFPDFNWISWNHWLKSFFSMFTKNDHLRCVVINFSGHHVTCWFDFDVFIHVLLLLVYFSFFWSKWLISIYLLASVSTDLHKNALKNSWTWIYKKN